MSYIIAFVHYTDANKSYPNECFRTDISIGDVVICKDSRGSQRIGTVMNIQYLNWQAKGRILCKLAEAKSGRVTATSQIIKGMVNHEFFIQALQQRNWSKQFSRSNAYICALGKVNSTHTAFISVRRNGVEIKIFDGVQLQYMQSNRAFEMPDNLIKEVKHYLANKTFNLFEGIVRFADSFSRDEENLDRYFVSQGTRDKRTEELKSRSSDECSDGIDIGGPYPDDMLYGWHCK